MKHVGLLKPSAVAQLRRQHVQVRPSSEDAEGRQDSTISVFTRDRDGTLRHSYSAHPWMADDVKERGIDLLTPVYNMLDLTPQGRDDWYAKLAYADGPHWPPRCRRSIVHCRQFRTPAAHACAARYACTKLTDMAPSPTAEA